MSQISQFFDRNTIVFTLTGDVGAAVGPDGAGDITISGGTNITTTGTPASNDITIDLDGTITLTSVTATNFYTDDAAAGLTISGNDISADGTDANIDINITPKGAGVIAGTELTLTTDLAVAHGGTGASTLTDHGVLVGSGTAAITPLAVGTNGQVLIGSTGADPVFANLSSTSGTVAYTEGAGTLDLNVSGGGIGWTQVAGTSVNMAVDNGYILNNVALVTATLPAVAVVGSVIEVVGKGAGGWSVAQQAGQQINFIDASTTVGVGGSLSSTQRYDSVRLVCTTANNEFTVVSSTGNLTIV